MLWRVIVTLLTEPSASTALPLISRREPLTSEAVTWDSTGPWFRETRLLFWAKCRPRKLAKLMLWAPMKLPEAFLPPDQACASPWNQSMATRPSCHACFVALWVASSATVSVPGSLETP